jgi:hypothetical protein
VKKLPNLVLDGSKHPLEQTRAHETKFKQTQNGVRLSSKLTLRNKRNKTREKHERGGHLQRNNSLTSLGNKASKRVSTLDMLQEVI